MLEHYRQRLAELRASYDEAARKRDEIGAALKAPESLTPTQKFDLAQKLDSLTADVKTIARQVKAVEAGITAAVEEERAALEARLGALPPKE